MLYSLRARQSVFLPYMRSAARQSAFIPLSPQPTTPTPLLSSPRGQEKPMLYSLRAGICLFFRHCERSAAICLIPLSPQTHKTPTPTPFPRRGQKRVPPHNIGLRKSFLFTLSWDCSRAGGSAGSYSTNVARLPQSAANGLYSNAHLGVLIIHHGSLSLGLGFSQGTLSAPCSHSAKNAKEVY